MFKCSTNSTAGMNLCNIILKYSYWQFFLPSSISVLNNISFLSLVLIMRNKFSLFDAVNSFVKMVSTLLNCFFMLNHLKKCSCFNFCGTSSSSLDFKFSGFLFLIVCLPGFGELLWCTHDSQTDPPCYPDQGAQGNAVRNTHKHLFAMLHCYDADCSLNFDWRDWYKKSDV